MGFAICAVVSFEDHHSNCNYPIFSCEFNFKTKSNEYNEFEWSFYDDRCHFSGENQNDTILKSDHVLMCYELSYHDENYNDYVDATKASFEFFLKEYDADYNVVNSFEVKKCGIRLLYLQDAEEFGIIDKNKLELENSNNVDMESELCGAKMVDENKRRRIQY